MNTTDLLYALPELFVLGMTCVVLLVDLFLGKRCRHATYTMAQLTLIGGLILSFHSYHETAIVFHGQFISDSLASLLKLGLLATTMIVFGYARTYIAERKIPQGEFYVLALFSLLGMMVTVSAYSFLALFLGLELMTLPLYAMVAMQHDNKLASEAGFKFFVMGALASGILLYGMSMFYGVTGGLALNHIAAGILSVFLANFSGQQLILVFGLIFMIVGIGFKFGMVPFHMWMPDVYEGAPTATTLFISTAPKIAGLGLALRILMYALPALSHDWQQILIVMTIASMALGNIAAVVQTNVKRMLAYSAIAQMGYMALGLLTATATGYASSVFYMLCYAIMSAGAFGILVLLSRAGLEVSTLDDLRGLNQRHPWLALMMLLIMFSMAGIPPTVGFFAKIGVFEALLRIHLVWLAAVALLFAIIGCYYYLNVVKVMYFEEPAHDTIRITPGKETMVLASINGLAVLLLGIFPSGLIDVCRAVFGI